MTRLHAALLAVLIPAIAAAQPGPKGCYDPVDFGAVPNDGINDRAAFQTALDRADGGGTVCIGPGRWRLDRAPGGSYNSHAAIATHGSHVAIRGSGPGTVLEMLGDQGLQQNILIALDPSASDVLIADLTLSTLGAYRTEEQTHVIATTTNCDAAFGTCKPIEDIRISNVTIVHPPAISGERKGDCVRLGSNANTPVRRVTILGSSFRACARSAVELQGEVYDVKIIANSFALEDGDQVIDGEATGARWIGGVQIIGNSFQDGPRMQGDYSVSLTSCRGAVVSHNLFHSRGLIIVRSSDVLVDHNLFDATMRYLQQGVVEVANLADRARVEDNTITRHGLAGFAIRVQPHSGVAASKVWINRNMITVDGDSSGIYVQDAARSRIEGNDVEWTAAAAPNGMGILVSQAAKPSLRIVLRGNGFEGASYHSAIRLTAAAGQTYRSIAANDNESVGGARSFVCEQNTAGTYAAPVVSSGNRWAVAASCASSGGGPATFAPGD